MDGPVFEVGQLVRHKKERTIHRVASFREATNGTHTWRYVTLGGISGELETNYFEAISFKGDVKEMLINAQTWIVKRRAVLLMIVLSLTLVLLVDHFAFAGRLRKRLTQPWVKA